jgi:hypothetical protein
MRNAGRKRVRQVHHLFAGQDLLYFQERRLTGGGRQSQEDESRNPKKGSKNNLHSALLNDRSTTSQQDRIRTNKSCLASRGLVCRNGRKVLSTG